jgi:hypothetical protein
MGQRSGLIKVLREAISRDRSAIESLKRGTFWVLGIRDGTVVNRNDEIIANAEARIVQNQVVLEACERADAKGS